MRKLLAALLSAAVFALPTAGAAAPASGIRPAPSLRTLFSPAAVSGNLSGGFTFGAKKSGRQRALSSADNAFFTLPNPLPSGAPGTILRWRDVTASFLGLPIVAHAYQYLYLTTDAHTQPTASFGTILVPVTAPASGRVLLSYQTAEDGLTTTCAPSHELLQGSSDETPLFGLGLTAGYDVLLSDYEGPYSEWTVGVNAGHEALDAIRAATHFAPAGLNASTRTILWGYSGGALATGWASELKAGYAPELNVIGAAMGGYPVDVHDIAQKVDGGLFSGIEFGGVVGQLRGYPEYGVINYFNAAGLQMLATVGQECTGQFLTLTPDPLSGYPYQTLATYTTVADPLGLPATAALLANDNLGGNPPTFPVYIYQGEQDELVPYADVTAVAAKYCAAGTPTEYVLSPIDDHFSLVVSGAPAAFAYLTSRVAGLTAPSNCS
jgi:hypothetical protein